jgi:hypothetical protein
MTEIKTKPTEGDVVKFIESVDDAQKRADSIELLKMMEGITGMKPVLWGDSMIGFDTFPYANSKGEINHWPRIGFSPRKQNLTLYITPGFDQFEDLLGKLGKHTTSKGCLYIKRLADVDKNVLRTIAEKSYRIMKEKNFLR